MILFLSDKDYANVGSRFAQALQAVNVEAEAWYRTPHRFDYPNPGHRFTALDELPKADTIIFMHSYYFHVEADRYGVFHGGTRYRERPDEINAFYNPKVDFTLIQTADLLNLGAKNEHWVIPPVEIDQLHPRWIEDEPIFGHFPNKREIKGSDVVEEAAKEAGIDLVVDETAVTWQENMDRINEVDVYIEELAPPYEFGVTALEAAALGKVVVTNCKRFKRYKKEFGIFPPLTIVDNAEELTRVLKAINQAPLELIRDTQQNVRNSVARDYSLISVGMRLEEVL